MLTTLSVAACRQPVAEPATDSVEPTVEVLDTLPRRSVTFVMGSDQSFYNQYYTMASHYYRLDPDERTEAVVEDLTSLRQVFEWLNAHPDTLRQRPYGHINLVSHGNEFIDLSATVVPRGERISAGSLYRALADSILAPPDSGIVDARTTVYLHGCAVGQNQPLLDAMARAFGGAVTVKASKLFEYYAYLSPNHDPQSIHHYFARTWYAFYNPDSAYDEASLVRQLQQAYPADTVDWTTGLRRRFQSNPSELYHYDFIVPCRYTEYYAHSEEMPSVGSSRKRQAWVDSHPDFLALLDSTRIPRCFFQTKFYRLTSLTDDEQLLLGIEVRARAGVICLIQPLVSDTDGAMPYMPYRPQDDDASIFAYSGMGEQTIFLVTGLPLLHPVVPWRL